MERWYFESEITNTDFDYINGVRVTMKCCADLNLGAIGLTSLRTDLKYKNFNKKPGKLSNKQQAT